MGTSFCAKSEIVVFKQDDSFPEMSSCTYISAYQSKKVRSKMEMFSLKDPFAWEFLVIFFLHACLHFKFDNSKHNRRSHVKLHNILFFLFFKKRKNEMKQDENKTLC